MKRVLGGCILQTLVFKQKEEYGYDRETELRCNREEVEAYKASLEKNKTRYRIEAIAEQSDGSVIVHVKKQLGAKISLDEYFN